MNRTLECPDCGKIFHQWFPDVTAAEAKQLKDAGDDSTVSFQCINPKCPRMFTMLRRLLVEQPKS